MTQIINVSIDNDYYPDDLKLAEVSQVFKKKDDLDKKTDPSVLSNVFFCQSFMSNVFNRIMY